jgi:hypothetical protein
VLEENNQMKMESFERLLEQIDNFIRKFYKNQMVKGLILFVGTFLLTFLVVTTLEYFGRFGSLTRAILFFTFVALNAAIFIKYILNPVLKLSAFGKRIDRYQASEIIGTFFPTISDRLKNTLQLQHDLELNEGNIELIRASVAQRSSNLSVIPFASAINMKENRKYAKYLIPLFLVIMAIGIASPSLFKQGTERVVNYSKEFKPEAPFQFYLQTQDLISEEGVDVPIEVVLKGNELPEHVYLISENGKFLMNRIAKNKFTGIIKKPKKSSEFYFQANEFDSDVFQLTVFGKATIGSLQASLSYPKYLGKEDEVIENANDLTVPEGTEIQWSVLTKNTKYIDFIINGNSNRFVQDGFKFKRRMLNNSSINILLANRFTQKVDSSQMLVTVVKDAYPAISVDEKIDTIHDGVRYFTGKVSDDYGLQSLSFVYSIISADGARKEHRLSVKKVFGVDLPFDFAVDFRRENVKLNDKIEYYFVVSDNDGVHGNKSTRSQVYTYKLPSLEELNDKRDEDQKETKESLTDLLNRTKDFQKNIDKLKKDVLNSKASDWNKMNQVNQLKEEQKSILESLQEMKQKMDQSTQDKNQLSEIDKQLLEKQEMIDKLLQELMDDELKSLLDEIEKLSQKNDKQQLKEKIENLQQSSKDMNKQLDRSLEMLKRLQVNEKIDDLEKELKQLSEQQSELQKEIESKKMDKDSKVAEQEKINDKFKEIQEDLKQLKELNKELSDPMELGNTENLEQKITDELKDSQESLQNSKDKKATEKQKSAADDMKEMANQMDAVQQEANKQQEEEDINSLRAVLESLMSLSFDQEEVMLRFVRVGDSDPSYRRFGRKQRVLIEETAVIRDSLLALAKRQAKIASFVDKELNVISSNQTLILDDIDEHRKRDLNIHQQAVMTAYNNLALLLNESLQSMQQQMQSMMQSSGSCNKPNNGKPKPGSMSSGDMKQVLKKQLEQMQKGHNPNGNKPGDQQGNKPGTKPGQGDSGMQGLGNKQVAKMAAEQTAIRQRLEQLRNELNKEGKGAGNQLNPLIKELEEQEHRLINNKFDQGMINRQQEILTRLLESEKALNERGFEEKRESTSGKNENYGNKIRFDEYNRQKLEQIELLRTIDPVYRKYYKDKANEYFNLGF